MPLEITIGETTSSYNFLFQHIYQQAIPEDPKDGENIITTTYVSFWYAQQTLADNHTITILSPYEITPEVTVGIWDSSIGTWIDPPGFTEPEIDKSISMLRGDGIIIWNDWSNIGNPELLQPGGLIEIFTGVSKPPPKAIFGTIEWTSTEWYLVEDKKTE